MLQKRVFHACMAAGSRRPNGCSVRWVICFSAMFDVKSAMPGTARVAGSSLLTHRLPNAAQRYPLLLQAQAIAMSIASEIIEHALL